MTENPKPFRDQFIECAAAGFHKQTECFPFEKNPNTFPAFPNKKMLLKSGEWKGNNLIICGRFGGICRSGHPKCQKLRGFKEIKLHPLNLIDEQGKTWLE
jgi:hypothetical protein